MKSSELARLIGAHICLHGCMAGMRMASPLLALRDGYSALAVGILLALFAAAPVLLALHSGRLADRYGYHRPVYIAAALVVSGMALAVASTFIDGWLHFSLLCVAGAFTGAGSNMGLLTIQRTAGTTARDNTERVRVFSWLGIAPSFANVVGPVAAGLMIDFQGFAAAYTMLLLLPLVTIFTARLVPRAAPPAAVKPSTQRTSWDLLQAPGMKRLLTINWLLSTCWDVHLFAVPLLGHERGFSASTVGLVLGTFTLSVTLVRLLIPSIAHRMKDTVVLRSAMLGTALVFALYPFASSPWLMGGCAALLGLTLGCVQPMVLSTLHHITPDQRHGEALAIRSMAMNASGTLMPLLFGVSGTVVGTAVLFWAVGGAVGAGSWLARRFGVVG